MMTITTAPDEVMPKLPQEETDLLALCEKVIHEHLPAAMAFAEALATIREHRLYRAEFTNFEDYCQAKWAIAARSARRLISQAEVWRNLAGANGSTWTVPASPSLVRPLISLPPELQREAWGEVVKTAPDGRPTVKHVEKIVSEVKKAHGLATEKAPAPAPAPAAHKPVVEAKMVGDREEQLEFATDRALDEMRALREMIGTSDSKAATGVIEVMAKLEQYKDHLRSLRRFQKGRDNHE